MKIDIDIITCPEWKAKPAIHPPEIVGKAARFIFHHTDGHHREISNPLNESIEEAKRYARDIQNFHMASPPAGRGWNDSGHNFLITRAGHILQGRWYTVTAIEHGHMVRSAHCPGQNTQIGIEHEHLPGERPTDELLEASGRLQAWVAAHYGHKTTMPVKPHKFFYNTDCPDNLTAYIPQTVVIASEILGGL